MIRLGESCSHVAALLTTVVKAVDCRKQAGLNACTSQACYWLPSAAKVYKPFSHVAVYTELICSITG